MLESQLNNEGALGLQSQSPFQAARSTQPYYGIWLLIDAIQPSKKSDFPFDVWHATLVQGEPFKTKKPDQIKKDDLCEEMARKILNGEISVDRYMDRMIEIMGDWDD